MIRICNLTGQITLEDNDLWFAFFDTIPDKFLEYNGSQVWSSWKDFEEDFIEYYSGRFPSSRPIERFKSLFESMSSTKPKEESK